MATLMQGVEQEPLGTQTCSSAATFLSSGVSGGSVGLAVAQATTLTTAQLTSAPGPRRPTFEESTTTANQIRESISSLTHPDTLAVGLSGTIVGDTVASVTGLRVQADGRWSDRAALIEDTWTQHVPRLADTFPWTEVGAPTGALVLNSTSVGQHCRVVLSQTDLTVPITKPPAAPGNLTDTTEYPLAACDTAAGHPAITVDFTDLFAGCLPDISYATAAMLSARFPVVTPSGRMQGDCASNSWQFIDGGYADGSGLGTIADIAPELARIVRDRNSSEGAGTPDNPFVIPVVAYLDDEPRILGPITAPTATVEPLVPLVGRGAQRELAGSNSWVQRISNSFSTICPSPSTSSEAKECAIAREELLGRIPTKQRRLLDGSVITVAPPLNPSIEVPLGWTLSQGSYSQLRTAAGEQVGLCTTATERSARRSEGFIVLSSLLCPPTPR
jgi:hypothetical protein